PGLPAFTPIPGKATDATDSFQTDGRAVDGRMACNDAGDGGCGPRSHARTQCLRDHGDPFDPRLLPALSDDLSQWRLRQPENLAAAPTHRAQPDPLQRPTRLVLRAHADPDRTGGGAR